MINNHLKILNLNPKKMSRNNQDNTTNSYTQAIYGNYCIASPNKVGDLYPTSYDLNTCSANSSANNSVNNSNNNSFNDDYFLGPQNQPKPAIVSTQKTGTIVSVPGQSLKKKNCKKCGKAVSPETCVSCARTTRNLMVKHYFKKSLLWTGNKVVNTFFDGLGWLFFTYLAVKLIK